MIKNTFRRIIGSGVERVTKLLQEKQMKKFYTLSFIDTESEGVEICDELHFDTQEAAEEYAEKHNVYWQILVLFEETLQDGETQYTSNQIWRKER